MTIIQLFNSSCACDEQLRLRLQTQQVVQPLHCFLVAPLQVVDEQQQGMRTTQYGAGKRLEKVVALPTFIQGRGNAEFRMFDEQLGQHSNKFRKL